MDPLATELRTNANKLIGYSFNLDSINSATYGSASNLKCEFFLTLPCQFRIPEDVQYPARLHQTALDCYPICRSIFPELLDEEAIAIIQDFALTSLMGIPAGEVDSEKAKWFTLIGTLAATVDDLIDNDDDGTWFESYKIVTETFNDLLGNLGSLSWKLIPNITNEMINLKSTAKYAFKLMRTCWPNYVTKESQKGVLISELKSTLQATLALKNWNNLNCNYSKTTTNELYRSVTGNILTLEILNLLFEIDVPNNIRQDILFKSAQNNFDDMLVLINAFFGLERDIKKNQIDNPLMFLVARKKKPIQEAFNECYVNYQGAYSDYMINVAKLTEVYSDDDNVRKYFHHMSWLLDGILTSCTLIKRYRGREITKPIYTED